MAPQPPSANDIILLKLLVQAGGSLTARRVDASIHLFDTRARSASDPGRYFLEKVRRFGWVEPRAEMIGGRKWVTYHITDAGKEAHEQFRREPAPIVPSNGHQTLP